MGLFSSKFGGAITTVIVGGSIALGTLVVFNGAGTIDQAIDTVQTYSERLNIFESNENKLAAKITELKTKRDELQVALDAMTATSEQQTRDMEVAQTSIGTLTQDITDLEAELALAQETAEGNGDELTERITALEGEVTAANEKVATLQTALESATTDAMPLTEEELDVLTETLEVPSEDN